MPETQKPKNFGEQDEYDISIALTLRAVPFGTVVRWQGICREPAGPDAMRHARNAIIETADPGFVPTTLPPSNADELGVPIEEVIEMGKSIGRMEDWELALALQTHFNRVLPCLGGLAAQQGIDIPSGGF